MVSNEKIVTEEIVINEMMIIKNLGFTREDVYKDIKYLYDRCVINGIKIDEYIGKVLK